MSREHNFDFLVIGSGIAGLTFALKVAKLGSVAIITKKDRAESNTNYAQGGIAAVTGSDDSFDLHVRDTLRAGAGLCKEDVVRSIVGEGSALVRELIELGVRFSESAPGQYVFGREGGHTRRRVLHAVDITGRAIERALLAAVATEKNITVFENVLAIDLITSEKIGLGGSNRCLGCYAFRTETTAVEVFAAKITLLASGGSGKVYLYTSNPDIASGEGGVLRGGDGEPFMRGYHEQADLAPRDIVARAIDAEMKKTGAECVWLDITHKDAEFIKSRFPNIYAQCLEFGVDMTREPIPVVPAAHYQCGGVVTNVDGETEIQGLYATGEVACTGLHGANRLASNSLLEALVVAHRAAQKVSSQDLPSSSQVSRLPSWETGDAADADELVVITHNWDEIRRCMWDYVGIVRTDKRLLRARTRIQNLQQEVNRFYWDYKVTPDLIELRNLALVAELIIESAFLRKESRGLHYTLDHPNLLSVASDTVLRKSRPFCL